LNTELTKLHNHVIVCGYGRNGKQACQQLESGNVKFVVIESNPRIIEGFKEENKVLFVEGNATEDEVLKNAGIERARGLIAALPDDASNVFVVLTAREMNASLKIISRASNDASENKLKRAGADNVIMPDKIGGTHMAALITKPDVLEFLDYMTGRIDVRLEEVHFNQLPATLQNKTIREIMEQFEKAGIQFFKSFLAQGECHTHNVTFLGAIAFERFKGFSDHLAMKIFDKDVLSLSVCWIRKLF
jgi:voltage-gated potassium channel